MWNYILFTKVLFLSSYFSNTHKINKNNPKVLLLSLDGFRHDYFDIAEKSGINLKSLKKVIKIGFKADHMDNVFLTRTFPNHLSIITGCFEETHGIIDNTFYDPDYNEIFSVGNISQSFESKWFSNAEPIWATNIKNGYKSGVIYWPGSLAKYGDKIQPSYSFGIYSWYTPLNFKLDLVLKWLVNHDTTLGIVYHPDPDVAGHQFGPKSKQVLATLLELDNSIKYLLSRIDSLGLRLQLNVIIVSDHGMTEVQHNCRIAMDNYVDPSLYHKGRQESHAFWGLWPRTNSSITSILSILRTVPNVTVFEKHEIPPQWNYRNSRRVAPIVVIADNGCTMVHKSNDSVGVKGTHGYPTSFEDMMGIFVAWGPNIITSNRSGVSVRAVDVFPLVAEILGMKNVPLTINGSLANVRWMLKRGTSDTGLFTSLIIICVLSLISVLSACIVISCAHYNASALRVQKIGNTYVLKSGNLVRKWDKKSGNSNHNRTSNVSKYKKMLSKKSKISEADDAAFLLDSNDEDEILGDVPTSNYKFNS